MTPMDTISFYVVLIHVLLAILLSWAYFKRYQLKRPPVGVLNLVDVAVMLAGVVAVPYLYLYLPIWLAALLLLSATASLVYFTLEPMLHRRGAIWLVTLALVAVDALALLVFGPASAAFFAVNNSVMVVTIVGITALWAQSGMRARDAAVLGAALAVYDIIFTVQLPLTSDLITRVAGLPFAPVIAWPLVGSQWSGIGLGDLLLAAVFPLVICKGYGRAAGIWTMGITIVAVTVVLALPIQAMFPTMVVLGPLMVMQYAYWRRTRGPERHMGDVLRAVPDGNEVEFISQP
jgi:hypothetical protein